jgi:hypothetical protein
MPQQSATHAATICDNYELSMLLLLFTTSSYHPLVLHHYDLALAATILLLETNTVVKPQSDRLLHETARFLTERMERWRRLAAHTPICVFAVANPSSRVFLSRSGRMMCCTYNWALPLDNYGAPHPKLRILLPPLPEQAGCHGKRVGD